MSIPPMSHVLGLNLGLVISCYMVKIPNNVVFMNGYVIMDKLGYNGKAI